jgi:hypothetical protein
MKTKTDVRDIILTPCGASLQLRPKSFEWLAVAKSKSQTSGRVWPSGKK